MSHAEIKMSGADASQLTVPVVGLIVAITQDSIAPTLLAHGMGDRPDVIDSKAKLRVGIECLPHINLTNAWFLQSFSNSFKYLSKLFMEK